MAMGQALRQGFSRKKALKKRSLMPMINRLKDQKKPAVKKSKRISYSPSSSRKPDSTGERIKSNKSKWRGRWHKEG